MMNMSYCRFENTLAALRECSDELYGHNALEDALKAMSEHERKCAIRLLRLCRDLAGDFEFEIEAMKRAEGE